MKAKIIILSMVAIFLTATSVSAQSAGDEKVKEVKIQTSGQCGMCKTKIESELVYAKGVHKAVLNTDDMTVTVTYDSKKTSPEEIRTIIAGLGYDADDVKADVKAYEGLPSCCKKKE